jgi:hypothetical protein
MALEKLPLKANFLIEDLKIFKASIFWDFQLPCLIPD